MTPVFGGDGTSRLTVGLVRFTPGRTDQLAPTCQRQLLVCTTASVWSALATGTPWRCGRESVWTLAGEEHFHGGTAQNMMCHYAILDAAGDTEATTWLEPVTDDALHRGPHRGGCEPSRSSAVSSHGLCEKSGRRHPGQRQSGHDLGHERKTTPCPSRPDRLHARRRVGGLLALTTPMDIAGDVDAPIQASLG